MSSAASQLKLSLWFGIGYAAFPAGDLWTAEHATFYMPVICTILDSHLQPMRAKRAGAVLSLHLEVKLEDYFCVPLWESVYSHFSRARPESKQFKSKKYPGYMHKTHIVCLYLYLSRAFICVHESSLQSVSHWRLFSAVAMGALKKFKIGIELSSQRWELLIYIFSSSKDEFHNEMEMKRWEITVFIITESALLLKGGNKGTSTEYRRNYSFSYRRTLHPP